MVFNSLTELPRNFREGIDWLVALKGSDAEKNLAAISDAVLNFLRDNSVCYDDIPAFQKLKLITKEFLEQEGLKDRRAVKMILDRFNTPTHKKRDFFSTFSHPIDEDDDDNGIKTWGITAENIVERIAKSVKGCDKFLAEVKIPGKYMSAYSSGATWSNSCTQKPADCAAVFVGITPMLYAGLMSLWDATDADDFRLFPSKAKKNLGDLLNALRYAKPECSSSLSRSDVVNALSGIGIEELDTLMELADFWITQGSENEEAVEDMETEVSADVEEIIEPVNAAESVNALKAEETVNDIEAEETVDEVEAEETVDEVEAEETVDEVEAEETVDEVEAEETVDEVEAEETVDEVEAEETVDEVKVEEPVKDVKAASVKPRVQYVKPVKPRKFYMGSRGVYGIPGVDINMGLLHAWNTKKYHNKRPQISTAAATGNFQCPGAPTVANLDAASPI
ncbi:Probable serine/threonine-protein kinase kinX [Babesia bigemina]|uniref:Probable serine/threonine-protein kinase kinX n=1 Tax=Babesia bigemina TaxID=5866 RepID=A0A061D862_BABBI|nr:Probable serine/threonine-protein kinase kinX [Babesia bigemina]CDR96177.1 Probable serine/threonine-protein kinase kinX [Babesia bigemina]|eukprot:XP_012768363.1 Probable serine/threonine-protein kinase kinX [Babesia bigemina]